MIRMWRRFLLFREEVQYLLRDPWDDVGGAWRKKLDKRWGKSQN